VQLNDSQHFDGVLRLLEAKLGASTALPTLTAPHRPPLPKGPLTLAGAEVLAVPCGSEFVPSQLTGCASELTDTQSKHLLEVSHILTARAVAPVRWRLVSPTKRVADVRTGTHITRRIYWERSLDARGGVVNRHGRGYLRGCGC
jgi:hypothetical protein